MFTLRLLRGLNGMIVTLSENGKLVVGYLGTDPSTSIVTIQSENKEFNYDEMDEELKKLQSVIREATSSTKDEPTDYINLDVQGSEEVTKNY
jgi:Bardet-Biedl syndrome 9 protein